MVAELITDASSPFLHDTQVRREDGFSVSTQSGLTVPDPCQQGQLSDTDKMRGNDLLSHTN